MVLGCALNVDILKAASLLSLTLQTECVDVVQGIKTILQAIAALQSLLKMSPKEWPTVKLVLSRIDSNNMYQGPISVKVMSPHAWTKPPQQVG